MYIYIYVQMHMYIENMCATCDVPWTDTSMYGAHLSSSLPHINEEEEEEQME